jgi:phage repressor protein C with HTH and peptisase S24 domain
MASLVSLAQAAGVSVEWLATGQGSSTIIKNDNELIKMPKLFITTPSEIVSESALRAPLRSAQIVDYMRFDPDWLQRHLGVGQTQIATIEAKGDSMSPTLDDGDLCLIDLRGERVKHDGLYALYDGADLSIKRLQREPDGAIMIRSDNAAYDPLRVAAEAIALAGRVIWICGKP